MKATRSKDGQPRFTFRVEHRIGRKELVTLLCCHAAREGQGTLAEAELPESPSRAWIERTAREVLKQWGHESWAYWSDDVNDEEAEAITNWAEDAVLGRFPELYRGVGSALVR